MMESTFNSSMIYYIMGVITIGGIISKVIVSVALKKLVQAASEMSKSTHAFMKLVRAKFEHACMVNDKVENIEVFVDKYMHEYQIGGIRLHSWQRMERIFVVLIGVLTLLGCGNSYYYVGLGEAMLQQALVGVALLALLLGIYQLVDEKFRIQAAKVYMVDYLENVCAHRYARGNALKEKSANHSTEANEINTKDFAEKLEEQMVNIELKQRLQQNKREREQLEKQQVYSKNEMGATEDQSVTQQIAQHMEQQKSGNQKQKSEEYLLNEATIREILQEFMA